MKRILAGILTAIMCLSCMACSNTKTLESSSNSSVISSAASSAPESSSTVSSSSYDPTPDEIYKNACDLYNSGNFSGARSTFEQVNEIKDTKNYLSKIDTLLQYQGTWQYTKYNINWEKIIIDGWNISTVYTDEDKAFTFTYVLEGNSIRQNVTSGDVYSIENGQLVYNTGDSIHNLTKIGSAQPIPTPKPNPKIGMTASEVLTSSWGNPDDTKTTITTYHKTEFWYYDGLSKYIVLEDGVVTSIHY